jgi:TnpA family transposase
MPRRELLTPTQRIELTKLPEFDERTLARFYTLTQEDMTLIQKRRGEANRLGFALQLTTLRHVGRTLQNDERPALEAVRFLAEQLQLDETVLRHYAQRDITRWEHLDEICQKQGYESFTLHHYRSFSEWLLPVALSLHQGLPLVTALLDELRLRKVLLPEITVLERLAASVRTKATRQIYDHLTRDLSIEQKKRLDEVLTAPEDERLTRLSWLRSSGGKTSASNILKLVEKIGFIRALGINANVAKRIHPNRLAQLAREGMTVTTQNLATFGPHRRYATLVSVLLDRLATLTDEALEMHDRLMLGLFRKSEIEQSLKLQESSKAINENLGDYARVGKAVIEARNEKRDAFTAIEAVLPWDDFVASVDRANALAQPERFDAMHLLGDKASKVRKYAPEYLATFSFQAAPVAQTIVDGTETLQRMYELGKRKVPEDAPTDFVRPKWEPYVFDGETLDRRYYELCVMNELRNSLRSGDIWVEGSRRHRNFEDHLSPQDSWREVLPLAVDENFEAYWNNQATKLHDEFETVCTLAKQHELPDVKIESGRLKITTLDKAVPSEAEQFAERVYRLLPKVKITELLLELDDKISFSRTFTHLHSGLAAENSQDILTIILSNAINLGLTRMAEAVPGSSMKKLSWLADWHVRDDTFSAALAEVINFQHKLPFAEVWGDGTTSSSDGQRFKTGGHGKNLGRINARYGHEPGVTFYTHVSDQYAPFHTKVIATTVRDATYVLDGLLYHESDLQIEEHYTDTAGFTEHVFALCHLLGFRFAPRIRDLAESRLYTAEKATAYPQLTSLIGGRVSKKRVGEQWQDILRLTASIKSGTVTASLMLSKLGGYPRQNGLALALRDLGRIQHSLFTLSWLQDPELRRRVQVGLNKGEARNTLANAVCLNRHGEIHDRTPQAQHYRASGLNLVVALIATWNTLYLGQAIDTLRKQGVAFDEDWLQHISPLGWEHINLTGDYIWETSRLPPKGQLRPLRLEKPS